jgi:type IV secretory pathway VirB2 component (pilin)
VIFLRRGKKGAADRFQFGLVTDMARQATVVLYIVLLAAVVVGVDLLFFRNRFWERLMVNIGIVLVFAAFYLRFLKYP